jgi:methylenetetrahydrofolate reductase (NADPH)
MKSDIARLAGTARLEVFPTATIIDALEQHVPTSTVLTVTCSPRHGVERTVEVCDALAGRGYEVVPHLAAHTVRGRGHLCELVSRLGAAGIDELFVVGGDGPRAHGQTYASAVELVQELDCLPNAPATVGIAGYPDGHPSIPDAALREALDRKAAHAHYVVTQMCFDADRIGAWRSSLIERGLDLQVVLGVPGVVNRRKLVEMSMKVGVGSSLRYLTKHSRLVGAMLRQEAYTADTLLEAVNASEPQRGTPLAGMHVFTFNQLEQTLRWLDALQEEARSGGPTEPQQGRQSWVT